MKMLLFTFYVVIVGILIVYVFVLRAISLSPMVPDPSTAHTHPYTYHGATHYITPLQHVLRDWLIPIDVGLASLAVFIRKKIRFGLDKPSKAP